MWKSEVLVPVSGRLTVLCIRERVLKTIIAVFAVLELLVRTRRCLFLFLETGGLSGGGPRQTLDSPDDKRSQF